MECLAIFLYKLTDTTNDNDGNTYIVNRDDFFFVCFGFVGFF